MVDNSLVKLREDRLKAAIKALDSIQDLSTKLKNIVGKVDANSGLIVNNIIDGQTFNKEETAKLWHDFNNIDHQIKQFSGFMESSFTDFKKSCEDLLEMLKKFRTS